VRAPEVKAHLDILKVQMEYLEGGHDELKAEFKKLVEEINQYRREHETELALVKREVEELKKGRDVWGGRLFTLVLAVASAVVGALLTYLVKKP